MIEKERRNAFNKTDDHIIELIKQKDLYEFYKNLIYHTIVYSDKEAIQLSSLFHEELVEIFIFALFHFSTNKFQILQMVKKWKYNSVKLDLTIQIYYIAKDLEWLVKCVDELFKAYDIGDFDRVKALLYHLEDNDVFYELLYNELEKN